MNIKRILFLLCIPVVANLLTGVSNNDSQAFAASTFEIPLGDLKKIEKKKQPKPEKRRSRKHKKTSDSDAEKTAVAEKEAPLPVTQEPVMPADPATVVAPAASAPAHTSAAASPSVAAAPQPASEHQIPALSPPPAPTGPGKPAESVPAAAVAAAVVTPAEKVPASPLQLVEDVSRISHEPYSYLVAGKLTSLMAVVISKGTVKSMYCRFKAKENLPYAEVEMSLVPGSKFTYSAVIPALIPGAAALYYEFVMVGSTGEKVQSRKYSIPLDATSVVPGWQHDLGRGRIEIVLENPKQPLEGFIGVIAKNE